jgi:hypothetical protein
MHRIFIGGYEGKRSLGRHYGGWNDNITMDLK